METGRLTLIGATTENPSFEVIPALLSRCRVFVLNELADDEIGRIIDQAMSATEDAPRPEQSRARGASSAISADAKSWLIKMSNGDARQAISMIENTVKLYDKITIETLKDTLQSKFLRYDKAGEEHYNIISAFIKSMRASQPDAALYYMCRMIEAGEDPIIYRAKDGGVRVGRYRTSPTNRACCRQRSV